MICETKNPSQTWVFVFIIPCMFFCREIIQHLYAISLKCWIIFPLTSQSVLCVFEKFFESSREITADNTAILGACANGCAFLGSLREQCFERLGFECADGLSFETEGDTTIRIDYKIALSSKTTEGEDVIWLEIVALDSVEIGLGIFYFFWMF